MANNVQAAQQPINTLSYHTFIDFLNIRSLGIVVPQRVYAPSTAFIPLPTVPFVEDNRQGIRLQDLLQQAYETLRDGASQPQLTTGSRRITIRILVCYISLKYSCLKIHRIPY